MPAVMEAMRLVPGLTVETVTSSCCGMAGAFGFDQAHYDVSMSSGERVLLPAVRRAEHDTLVIADGFSCRTQVEEATSRRPLHLAEVLALALDDDASRGASGEERARTS